MTSRPDLGVVGIGLIGGSIAGRARRAGATVLAADPSAGALADARRLGLIDGACERIDDLLACRTLVVAAPVDAAAAMLAALQDRDEEPWPELIVDAASVKSPFAGLRVRNFVPTHPFAGSQRSGAAAARADLFTGRPWAYVPAAPAATARAIAFIESMGARPVAVEAAAHDEIAALVSHLPQLTSVALGVLVSRRLDDPGVAELAGPGLESMLRLAGSSAAVWMPILAANGERIAALVREAARTLDALAGALERGEIPALASYFADARRAADRTEGADRADSAPRIAHNEGNPR